jgi:hypothetical protein
MIICFTFSLKKKKKTAGEEQSHSKINQRKRAVPEEILIEVH